MSDNDIIPIALMNLPVDYEHEFVDFRIVGGQAVSSIRRFPWMTSLKNNIGKHFCGAMLIHPSWILTAKHCSKVSRTPDLWIGGLDLNKPEEFIKRKVKNMIEYPDEKVDVLLIEMNEPITDRMPVKLNNNPNIPIGTNVDAVGWGRLSEGGSVTSILQEVVLKLVSDEKCKILYPDKYTNDKQLCAGIDEGEKDACQGDSGGPLVVMWDETDPATQFLIGVTSMGIGCARKGKYGVWVKTSYILPWIAKNIPGFVGYDVMSMMNRTKPRTVPTPPAAQNLPKSAPLPTFPSFQHRFIEPFVNTFTNTKVDNKSMTMLVYSLIILTIVLMLFIMTKYQYI